MDSSKRSTKFRVQIIVVKSLKEIEAWRNYDNRFKAEIVVNHSQTTLCKISGKLGTPHLLVHAT